MTERALNTTHAGARTPALHWNAKQVKALLYFQLEKLPDRHLACIEQRGGPEALISSFLAYPLSPIQRKILRLMVAEPGAAQQHYVAVLHVHRSTFSEWFGDLARRLASLLNAEMWSLPFDQRYHAGAGGVSYERLRPMRIIPFPGVRGGRASGLAELHGRLLEVHQAIQRVEERLAVLQQDR